MTNAEKIAELEASLTGDMMKDMNIRQEIHDLEMSENHHITKGIKTLF